MIKVEKALTGGHHIENAVRKSGFLSRNTLELYIHASLFLQFLRLPDLILRDVDTGKIRSVPIQVPRKNSRARPQSNTFP